MFEFKLPDVGEGLHEAEVVRWLVKEGDAVGQDQPIVEVQTDKAVTDLPSPRAGRIAAIHAPVGQLARVGDVLVVIEETTDHRPPTASGVEGGKRAAGDGLHVESGKPSAAYPDDAKQSPIATPQSPIPNLQSPPRRVLAAPAVRKLALQLGVDLTEVQGSGPVGRVLPEDVRAFATGPTTDHRPPTTATVESDGVKVEGPEEAASAPLYAPPAAPHAAQSPISTLQSPPDERVPLHGLRRRIAERMEEAWRIPHVTSFEEADASALVTLRATLQPEAERRGVHLTYLPLLIKMTVQALREYPTFNASLDMAAGEIVLRRSYHIGVATAIDEGLVVPVVRQADRLSLFQVAMELGRLAEGARQRSLTREELSGSTFTITNFGSFGGQQGTPIINPPEVAILGLGRIENRAVVIDGRIEARPTLPLALSYDHRLLDGAAAARFLLRLKALVANPTALLLDLA